MTKDQCDNFQKSLDSAQTEANALKTQYGADSDEYKNAQSAIGAHGKENVDNGVTVQIGDAGGWMGNTDVSTSTVAPTKDNPNGQQITVTFASGATFNGSAGSGLDIAHEGVHVADASKYVSSGFDPSMNPTSFSTEMRAFQVQANLASTTGYILRVLPPGVKDPITVDRRGFSPAQVSDAIKSLLKQG